MKERKDAVVCVLAFSYQMILNTSPLLQQPVFNFSSCNVLTALLRKQQKQTKKQKLPTQIKDRVTWQSARTKLLVLFGCSFFFPEAWKVINFTQRFLSKNPKTKKEQINTTPSSLNLHMWYPKTIASAGFVSTNPTIKRWNLKCFIASRQSERSREDRNSKIPSQYLGKQDKYSCLSSKINPQLSVQLTAK